MNIKKKISAAMLAVCLCISFLSTNVFAADGRISFTDPQTAVGDTVDVKCVLRSTSGTMGKVTVGLAYDKDSLKFESGDGVTDNGNGSLTYEGQGGNSEISFTVKFQALKEGTAKISVSNSTVSSSSGQAYTLESGNSTVTIAEGDPSKITDTSDSSSSANDVEVKVNGKTYTLTDDFEDKDIPSGYSRTKVSFEGKDHQMVVNGKDSIYLGYLKKSDGKGAFFLYDKESATFSVYEEVSISDTTSIILLNDESKVTLPSRYKKAKLTLKGEEFPVWQDTKNEDYYVMYAMNSDGENGYYQYDSTENTYQRFTGNTEEADSDTKKTSGNTTVDKLQNIIENHFSLAVLVVGLTTIIAFVLIIVLTIKLRHRDLELDDLYDEYGIDMDEEEVLKAKKKETKKEEKAKKASKKVKKKPAKKYYDEDEFEGYDDDFDDEDPWITENIAEAMDTSNMKSKKSSKKKKPSKGVRALDETGPAIRKPVKKINLEDTNDFEAFTPLDEEAFDNFEGYYSEDDDYDLFGAGYDDDDLFDATADLLSNHPEKRRSHAEMDDTFKMDVIDLD